MYQYYTNTITEEGINAYADALMACGFERFTAQVSDENDLIAYKYKDTGVILGLMTDAFFGVTIIYSPNADDTDTTPMYEKHPSFPDFGVITGATLIDEVTTDDGAHLYEYSSRGIFVDNPFTAYSDVLLELGFEYEYPIENEDYRLLIYAKGDLAVGVGIWTDTTYGVVIFP